MNALSKVWNWLKQYNASTHALAIVGLALPMAYEGYAPFHALVTDAYNLMPGWLQALIGTGIYLFTLYKTGALKLTNPGDQGTPGMSTGTVTKIGALLLVAAVACGLTGCPNATLQRAAQASQNAAIIVQGLENAEIAAHSQGLIPNADHVFVQREVATLAAMGKTTDSCIAGAGSTTGAVACINTAVTQIDKINADGALYLKSTTAKQDFSIAMSGVKTVLLSIETTLTGAATTPTQ